MVRSWGYFTETRLAMAARYGGALGNRVSDGVGAPPAVCLGNMFDVFIGSALHKRRWCLFI